MPYCPYTDRDLDLADTSPEHIIPLSLGGIGEFQIPVCKAANSEVGSRIDGAMSRDFLTMTQRDRYDVRGHSNKEPVFVAKHCSDPAGKPLQVALGQRTGLQVWSPRDKEYIRDERAKTINITFSIEKDLPSQFVAKVALSAGYFAYGEVFRKQVKHSEFRTIMNYNPANINIDEIRGLEALPGSLVRRSTRNVFSFIPGIIPLFALLGCVVEATYEQRRCRKTPAHCRG